MNRGTLNGYRKGGWRNFAPTLRTVTAGGGSTQPSLNTSKFGFEPAARWLELDNGLVIAQYQISFTPYTSVGTGDAYLLRLPKRANRWATYPFDIGTGMAYQALGDPSENMPITPQLAATGTWTEITGEEDLWMQMGYAHAIGSGQQRMINGAFKTTTVTHFLGYTPDASDISVTPTTLPNANTHNQFYIQNITSTTFDVATRANIGTGDDWTFGWKAIVRPNGGFANYLVGPTKPWTWGSTYLLLAQVYYQAA